MRRNQKPNKPRSTSVSKPRPTSKANFLTIIIKSMMQSSLEVIITVPKNATVGDLKTSCRGKIDFNSTRYALMFDNVELKDDEMPLRAYGIVEDCEVYLVLRMQSGSRETTASNAGVILIVPSMFQADDIRQALAGMHKQLSVKPPKDSSERRSVREPKPDPAYDLERQMEHELTRNRMKNLKLRRKNASANSSLNNSANGTPTAGSQNQSPLHSDPGTPGSQGQSPLGSQNQSPLHSDPGTPGSRGQSPLHSEPGTPQNELVNPAPSSPKAKDLTSGRESSVEPSGPSVIVKEFYFDPRLNDEEEEFQMMRKDRLKIKDNGKKKPANTCGLCRRRLSVVQQAVKCQCSKSFCFLHRATSLHNCSVDYKQAGRRKLQKDNPKCEEGGAHKGQFED